MGEFRNMHCTCSPDSSSCSCSLPFLILITAATETNVSLKKKKNRIIYVQEKHLKCCATYFNYWNSLRMLLLINIHKLFPVLWNSETTTLNSQYKRYASKPWYLFQFTVFFFPPIFLKKIIYSNCDTLRELIFIHSFTRCIHPETSCVLWSSGYTNIIQ